MPAFKDQISPALVRDLARELRQAWPAFPSQGLTRGVAATLEPLELLARVDVVAERLAATLPDDFGAAADVLWRALDSPTFTGWMTLPCGTVVARAGLDHPEVALPLLAGLTPRWSSEAPIRPFIERHPNLTYEYLHRWSRHEDEHVRRLVSEGTRPRLPWAPLLRGLIADPAPNLPLVDRLVDDPSPYVRRSVANHLNDISKDHPDLALDLAEKWLGRGNDAAWVVRHGLRTLVKRGNSRALELIGVDVDTPIELTDLSVDPPSITIGDAVTIRFTLGLAASSPAADCVVDYRVHYAGARGVKAPKVFKLTKRHLRAGEPVTITRQHRFAHVSIRRIHPGRHQIDVQVNGAVLGSTFVHVSEG